MYQAEGGMFSGNLLLDVLDADGNQTGEYDVGNTQNFTIDPLKITEKTRIGRRNENYGNVVETVITEKTQALKFSLDDIQKKNLAMALFGSDSVVNQAAVTVTDEPITARLDKEVKLSKMKLKTAADAPVVKDAATELITYVEGTDYEVDYTYGTIKAITGGAITEALALEVTFKCNAYTGYNIQASTLTKIDALLRLKGKNIISGKECMVTVHKASLKPTGSVDFITDNFAKLEFAGEIQAVGGITWELLSLD